jgi:sec-independent protein translocase protein TatA
MLEGWEWIIIGVVAIVIIMWGPAKIPQFARALGQAKGEFSKASKEFNDAAKLDSSNQPVNNAQPQVAPVPVSTIKSKDQLLLETAQGLGIPTEGKTREQLSEEISMKAKLLGAE